MVDHGDDDVLSGFLLGLATSHAALGFFGLRLSLLMAQPKQAIQYLPPLPFTTCRRRQWLNSTHPKTTGGFPGRNSLQFVTG